MNVTVFATVGQVAVWSSFPFSCFWYYCSFPAGRKSLESGVVSPSSEMVIVVCVVFTYCKWRRFLFAPIAVIGSWEKKKMLWKLQFSQLFGQLIVESIEKCFCLFFVFYAHSHCSVSSQVWPWLCSRSVRFTRNKHFFLANWLFSACCCYSYHMSRD